MLFCRSFPEIWPVCPPWWPLSIWANCARIKSKYSLNPVDLKTREVNKMLSRTYNWKHMFYNRKKDNNCEWKCTEFNKKQGWWGWTFYNCSFPNLSPASSVTVPDPLFMQQKLWSLRMEFTWFLFSLTSFSCCQNVSRWSSSSSPSAQVSHVSGFLSSNRWRFRVM